MKLHDLMAIWQSQDASPLHGVNETLLRLALRQDETKRLADRRLATRLTHLLSAFFVAVMIVLLVLMIRQQLIAWEYLVPLVGMGAALFWPGAMRVLSRAHARREERFGDSLRDQLSRQMAQLDHDARKFDGWTFHLLNNLPAVVWSISLFFAILRINGKPYSAAWADHRIGFVLLGMIVFCVATLVGSTLVSRRVVKSHLVPQQRRLQSLLEQLDECEESLGGEIRGTPERTDRI